MISYLFELEDPAAEIMMAIMIGAVAKLVGLVMVRQSRKTKFQQIGTVAHLYLYPVKSCGVLEEKEADVTAVGLHSDGLTDRHWMILGSNDQIIHMKREPRLTLITCQSVGDKLRLSAPGMPALDLPKKPNLMRANVVPKKFCEQTIPVIDCGQEAADWISEFIKCPTRIVFSCPELGTRDAYEEPRRWENTSKKGDVTVFAYLTSYLMTSMESLRNINSQLEMPVAMVNFRPNIVIENSIPFDEDDWKEIRIGEHTLFHAVEPCRRCPITTVDPKTGEMREDKQPLDLLKSFRCRKPYGTAPIFGLYVSNDIPGHIKVGDPVYVIKDWKIDCENLD